MNKKRYFSFSFRLIFFIWLLSPIAMAQRGAQGNFWEEDYGGGGGINPTDFLLVYLVSVGVTYMFVKIKELNWSNGKILVMSIWTMQLLALLFLFLF